jgi:hypothetical protein
MGLIASAGLHLLSHRCAPDPEMILHMPVRMPTISKSRLAPSLYIVLCMLLLIEGLRKEITLRVSVEHRRFYLTVPWPVRKFSF